MKTLNSNMANLNHALFENRHEKIGERSFGGRTASAWMSREIEDASWDEFLQKTPLGHFQQSTIWARYKFTEGWKPLRVVLTLDGVIAGGFQIVWRSSRWGRIAYVSKGPVVLPGCVEIAEYATVLLQGMAQKERLRGLVVQPPDTDRQLSTHLASAGFTPDITARLSEATWVIELSDGFEAVTRRMQSETRRRARLAADRGVTVREGGRQDLETFFNLMLSTCRRQKVSPKPRNVHELFALWDAAQPARCLRLFFAEYRSKPLAASLNIGFGKTFTLWRKGWTSTESDCRPNDALSYEALKWACLNGYWFADFAAFDRGMAVSILRGERLTPKQTRTRYMFYLRFGGSPRLLPRARVYFPNSWLRGLYGLIFERSILRAEQARLSSA